MSTTETATHLANSGTRPYTAAERAALSRIRANDVERIREASERYDAHARAAGVLATAAYWIAAGAVDEAHELIAQAAAAHREAVTR